MPKVPADFKGHKSYYEMRTEKPLGKNSLLAPDKAKIHSKAKVSKFEQKQAKFKP